MQKRRRFRGIYVHIEASAKLDKPTKWHCNRGKKQKHIIVQWGKSPQQNMWKPSLLSNLTTGNPKKVTRLVWENPRCDLFHRSLLCLFQVWSPSCDFRAVGCRCHVLEKMFFYSNQLILALLPSFGLFNFWGFELKEVVFSNVSSGWVSKIEKVSSIHLLEVTKRKGNPKEFGHQIQ